MNELGIKPEHECFDVGHVGSLTPLIDMGVLDDAAARRLRHGRRRRRPADRAQPRGDGRQPRRRARRPAPLGRDRHLARAVDAGRRGARRSAARSASAWRTTSTCPTATMATLQRRADRQGPPDGRGRRPARRRPSRRHARCSACSRARPRERDGLLKMAELAERSGVSAGTIKHYLREGLLGGRRRGRAHVAQHGLLPAGLRRADPADQAPAGGALHAAEGDRERDRQRPGACGAVDAEDRISSAPVTRTASACRRRGAAPLRAARRTCSTGSPSSAC